MNLKKLAGDRVRFIGYVRDSEELMALYQNCFTYIHGHKFGGTNPAMLKAMSNNCAILALDTRFNKEMLRNGELGLFFEESTKSIISAMNKLEKHPEFVVKLKTEVSSGLTEKYNWDSVTAAYQLAISNIYK